MTQTYRTTQSSRGDSEVGPCSLTYTDTIDFAARTVTWSVVGNCEGEYVNQRGVRFLGPEFTGTPESVDAYRLRSGWHRVGA